MIFRARITKVDLGVAVDDVPWARHSPVINHTSSIGDILEDQGDQCSSAL